MMVGIDSWSKLKFQARFSDADYIYYETVTANNVVRLFSARLSCAIITQFRVKRLALFMFS